MSGIISESTSSDLVEIWHIGRKRHRVLFNSNLKPLSANAGLSGIFGPMGYLGDTEKNNNNFNKQISKLILR